MGRKAATVWLCENSTVHKPEEHVLRVECWPSYNVTRGLLQQASIRNGS